MRFVSLGVLRAIAIIAASVCRRMEVPSHCLMVTMGGPVPSGIVNVEQSAENV